MDQDVFILRALLAQQGSRHFETAGEVMDAIRRYGVDTKKVPSSLLMESYTNVMSQLKLTLRELLQHQNSGVEYSNQEQENVYNIIEVSDNIEAYSRAVLHVVIRYFLYDKDLDIESRIVYLNLKGDCYRNLAEILTEKQNKVTLECAILAYDTAHDLAVEKMHASSPIKVQVALSYSSFTNDLLDDTKSAYQIASAAFSKAQAELNKSIPEIFQHNTLLRKLYDNVIQWMNILSFQNTDFILKLNPTILKFEQINRSEFVEKAMLSRDMKRYKTMAATMKNLIKATNTANLQEAKLFSEAFQKLVDELKLSLGKNIISEHILNNEVMIEQDTKIFFMNMKSKYFKYMSEACKSVEQELDEPYGDNVVKAYSLAQAMQPTSDIRLEATLNFAIFMADNKNQPETAYEICNTELKELGIHEKEVEDLHIVPKMHCYMHIWNMKQQNKFSSLYELTTTEYQYIGCNYFDLASIGEDSKRYLDMAVAVKNLIDIKRRLNVDEKDMFNLAFKKLVDERRKSLRNLRDTENLVAVVGSKTVEEVKLRLNITVKDYRNNIKDELRFLCWYTIHLLNTLLSIDDIENDSKLYYLRMKGDFYRYLTEIYDTTRQDAVRNALNAYEDAHEIAMTMSPVDAYRLELMVNYAAFLYDAMDDKDNAASMLRRALHDIDNKEVEDSSVPDIVEKIKINLSRWFSSDTQQDSMPQTSGLQYRDLPKKTYLPQKKKVLQSNVQPEQKGTAQKKDNEAQKDNFQAKTIVPPTNYVPEKKSVSQTDNMSEKWTVSQQDLPGKTMVSQKDKFPAKSSSSQIDNLSKKNTGPQASISVENANGSVNRNLSEKDKTKLKEKPRVKPPKETKKRKKTKKTKTAHKKK